jgi:uncharacterized membrane protein SpoIIM required for sporulation
MRETAFLKQNEKKWKEFELLLKARKGSVSPDKIADLFIEVTDDLAFARTHYPESNTVHYLNGLAGQVHLALAKNKSPRKNSFWAFWKYELPLIMAGSQGKLVYAFLIFLAGIGIGVVSTIYDENFLRLIMSNDYVEMTLKNIKNNDPLGVYASDGEINMFFYITIHNIQVTFLAFVAGIFFSLGTAFLLARNGIMVGSFQAFMYTKGHLEDSFLVVYIHGVFELSAIILGAAAGFHLGHSLLFPRTFTRMESLKRGAMKGLKIMLGIVPVLIAAGFLESFVTRYTQMPKPLSLLIIFGTLSIIVYYFVIYPLMLKSRGMTLEQLTDGELETA